MHYLVKTIIKQLELELETAAKASQEARSSATHSENIATSRYDTLALEAAYLAHGQSIRIVELQEAIALFRALESAIFTLHSPIELGALIELEDEQGKRQKLFLGPCAGGLRIVTNDSDEIQVVTKSSPLGQAMLNKHIDDEILVNISGKSKTYSVISIQ